MKIPIHFCAYCSHAESAHKITELPGDRSRDIYVEGRLCLPHRPFRVNCRCGCGEFEVDWERYARRYRKLNGGPMPDEEKVLFSYGLRVRDLPKFIKVYAYRFGNGDWPGKRAEVRRYRAAVAANVLKPKRHVESIAELAEKLYG